MTLCEISTVTTYILRLLKDVMKGIGGYTIYS